MKIFKEYIKEVKGTETNESYSKLKENVQSDIEKLESIIRRYQDKNSFMIRQMVKHNLGDYSKEGKNIAKLTSDALAVLIDEFAYSIDMAEK